MKTFDHGDRTVLLVVGGDPIGTLYGAYRLAEHLGVRFYLHGDVVPDHRLRWSCPRWTRPASRCSTCAASSRSTISPRGPTGGTATTTRPILGQLPKLRMNFFGLHTYPEGGVGPEPLVWIGPPGDIGPDGKVKASYPSRHFTTGNVTRAWGYRPMKTSDYVFGAAELFDRDDYGADYMRGDLSRGTACRPSSATRLFDRMGELLRDAFAFARAAGRQDLHRHGNAADDSRRR